MAENKKQHFVPQHYLKGFSQDEESLYRYNLKTKESSQKSIKNSCQSSYFYGEEDEKVLHKIENEQAPVLHKLIETQNLKILTSDDFYYLRLFLLLQYTRTKESKKLANKMFEKIASKFLKPMLKSMLKSDEELKKKRYTKEYVDSCEIRCPEFYKLGMNAASDGVDAISDLEPILIINKTDKNFICSDAPVVLYNYKKMKNRRTTGFLWKGLQIFCPLTKNILLLLIDNDLYEFKKDNFSRIFIDNDSDVDSINKLQIFNCLDHVFFSRIEDTDYVRNLHLEVEDLIKEKEARLDTVQTIPIDERSYSELVLMYTEDIINYKLKLSFIKLNRLSNMKYKRMVKKFSKTNPYFVLVRNMEIANRYTLRRNEIVEGKDTD